MADGEFSGRTALITGGSRGIGRAISVRLAREGANVAVNYVADEAAAQRTRALVEAEGARCATVKADVSDPDQVGAMVAEAERALAPIDLLVTAAGVVDLRTGGKLDFAVWRRLMAVNLDGTFLAVAAVKDGMIARGWGRIVCIASIAGLAPRPFQIAYATSKAAVIALVRNCAPAFAPNLRINAVAPGLIDTEMTAGMDAGARRSMVAATPLGREGRPEEIAEMALFLLSDRSSFTTGQTLVASGGRVILP
jgi:3-oxoacyl-[acyl-carrier protein] reductase